MNDADRLTAFVTSCAEYTETVLTMQLRWSHNGRLEQARQVKTYSASGPTRTAIEWCEVPTEPKP